MVEAGQKERQRLERDLHDGAQQRLVALSLELSLLERAARRRPRRAGARWTGRGARSRLSLEELRDLARGIHPAVVSGHGLAVALESLAARAPLPVQLTVDARRPAAGAGRGRRLLRRLREPRQHRQARARVDGRRRRSPARTAQLVVEVVDDGIGGADTERGSGLRGLADRVEALGGRLRVWTPQRRRHARQGGDPVRVAIAEDSVLLREGLARLLGDAGFDVVGQCGDADDLLLKVRSYSPDVAIVDIRLPPTHSDEGMRAALEIRAQYPGVGVLVLSQYIELGLAMKLLADSADGVGYLLKDRIATSTSSSPRSARVADGGSALDPIIVSTLLVQASGPTTRSRELTPREREVLELMADGQLEPGDRRQARDHASAPSRSTSRASSASSACPRRAASRAACWPCCSTCAPSPSGCCSRRRRSARRSARRPAWTATSSPCSRPARPGGCRPRS